MEIRKRLGSCLKAWNRGRKLLDGTSFHQTRRCIQSASWVAGNHCKTSMTSRRVMPTLWQATWIRNVSNTPSVTRLDDNESLTIKWNDTEVAEYPYVWLRDSCLCHACHQPVSKSRLLTMQTLNVDCKPKDIQMNENSNSLTIVWDDDHVSSFQFDWLQERGYSPEALGRRQRVWPLAAESWGSELINNLPTDTFDNLMTDDLALYKWICQLEQKGFFVVTAAPCEAGQLHKLGERVAFLRTTNYGKEFSVKAKIDPSNAAYTTVALGLHTDLPFYFYTPGIQLLHCIKQVPTKGGENQFADGFRVAEQVKHLRPDYYQVLCSSPLEYYDIGVDYYKFHKLSRKPVIVFDREGRMTQINYNNQVRDYFAHLPAKELIALYRAMRFYDDTMYKAENHINIKLKDGEIACFHNYRVLHGREGFEMVVSGERHYEGGYMDWDELFSRRRVIQQDMNL